MFAGGSLRLKIVAAGGVVDRAAADRIVVAGDRAAADRSVARRSKGSSGAGGGGGESTVAATFSVGAMFST